LQKGDVIEVRIKEQEASRSGEWKLALEQTPDVQSALLSMAPESGSVKSMIGGWDFLNSQFNRAVQSLRQPGSAFKPIIYAAAIDRGYTPATTIADTPVVYEDTEQDFTWKPRNYDNTFHGFTLLRDGLIHSRNVITVKIVQDIGISYLVEYAQKLGIESHLERDLSLALGSSGMSLLELVGAYAVFANQGEKVEPQFINRIEDRRGNVLYLADPQPERVIEKSTAYILTHMMEQVVQEGTGWRLKALNRPAAGKTGTTNNLQDAWFVGYTPEYVTGVWVGMDNNEPLGARETGSRAAAPIWLDYMQTVLKDTPRRFFSVPDSVVFAKIDADTGLLPIDQSRKVIYECFKEGTVPRQQTPMSDAVTESEDFFRKGIQ
ncbi:MAG: penicillin-binding transpeptidase domain-containing protein, partial [Thermodesulfobacteriota bacterium]